MNNRVMLRILPKATFGPFARNWRGRHHRLRALLFLETLFFHPSLAVRASDHESPSHYSKVDSRSLRRDTVASNLLASTRRSGYRLPPPEQTQAVGRYCSLEPKATVEPLSEEIAASQGSHVDTRMNNELRLWDICGDDKENWRRGWDSNPRYP